MLAKVVVSTAWTEGPQDVRNEWLVGMLPFE